MVTNHPSRKLSKLDVMETAGGSKDELISNILLWNTSDGRAKAGRPAQTYIQQLFADTGYSLEDLPGAVDDRDGRRERVWKICADGTT